MREILSSSVPRRRIGRSRCINQRNSSNRCQPWRRDPFSCPSAFASHLGSNRYEVAVNHTGMRRWLVSPGFSIIMHNGCNANGPCIRGSVDTFPSSFPKREHALRSGLRENSSPTVFQTSKPAEKGQEGTNVTASDTTDI